MKIPGIIISASAIRVKATRITIQCRGCKNTIPNIGLKPGLEGYAMPRNCPTDQTTKPAPCPMDPFFILPDKCKCVDFQVRLIFLILIFKLNSYVDIIYSRGGGGGGAGFSL